MIPEINEKEYKRLYDEEMNNQTSWIFRDNLSVDSFINTLFEENEFLYRIMFDEGYEILKNKKFIDNTKNYFDHYYAVTFKNNVSQIDAPETISGIMNFPYMSWKKVENFIDEIPHEWRVFIINPILMRYCEGSIGLFLTPRYEEDYYIESGNDFIKSRTGYPLFLKYSAKDNIKKIIYDKPELTLENYVEDMKKYGQNKGLAKLLDFWKDNDCVKIDSFENSFNDYTDYLPHRVWHDINFKDIKSPVPFELIHEKTGEVLGPYNRFCLDKSFKLADVDNGVLNLSDSQISDLIEGNYDFKLIK